MAGTRAYRRDSHGRFAGSGGGTTITTGRSGGFANAGFRSRVAGQQASANKSLGATAGTKGRLHRPQPRNILRSVGRSAVRHPQITSKVVVAGLVVAATSGGRRSARQRSLIARSTYRTPGQAAAARIIFGGRLSNQRTKARIPGQG